MDEIFETKLCNTCGRTKPKTDFHKDRHKSDGLHTMCKTCKRNYRTSPFYSQREYELEFVDGKRNRHFKKRNKKYDSNDGGSSYKATEHHIVRSTLQKEYHSLTYEEWRYIKLKQENKCAICGVLETQETKLVHDCIIPLSRGGTFCYDNVQALCNHCNSVKGAKIYDGVAPGSKWRESWIVEPNFYDAKLLSQPQSNTESYGSETQTSGSTTNWYEQS